MESVRQIVDRLGGIATRQQLIAAGRTGLDLTIAVRGGEVHRIRQARYASATAMVDGVVAARVGGRLAGASAAKSYGLWPGFDERLHIVVGATSSRLRTNAPPSMRVQLSSDMTRRPIALHWLQGAEVPELGPECWRVSIAETLRQTVRWADAETAIACLDTARLKLPASTMACIFESEPESSKRMLRASRPGSESGPESLVRQRLAAIGLELIQQVPVPGIGRLDGRIAGTKVVLEIDSSYHDNDRSFESDRIRDAELAARGYVVVRLTYRQITTDWAWCERMVLAAVARFHDAA
ncbi:MAG: DUF559 domain-containing protein [Burkholderiaceae bacterium]|nr:DUF559 domain-containing protein [Microbacteriaceae bacterium]